MILLITTIIAFVIPLNMIRLILCLKNHLQMNTPAVEAISCPSAISSDSWQIKAQKGS
jgi:hypothetical protein